jgi:hypothetical protein
MWTRKKAASLSKIKLADDAENCKGSVQKRRQRKHTLLFCLHVNGFGCHCLLMAIARGSNDSFKQCQRHHACAQKPQGNLRITRGIVQ